MRYALGEAGERIEVEYSGQKALCPGCKTPVFGRRPKDAVDHWAHVSKQDCLGCYEPMTQWHRDWQNEFPIDSREITVKNHRADVFVNGIVIEFQHSSLPGPQITSRENTYQKMVWVLHVERSHYPEIEHEGKYRTVQRWKAETSQLDRYRVLCRSPVFFDFEGIGIVHVHTFERKDSAKFPRGTGELMTKREFVDRVYSGWLETVAPIAKKQDDEKREPTKRGTKREWNEDETGETCSRIKVFAATKFYPNSRREPPDSHENEPVKLRPQTCEGRHHDSALWHRTVHPTRPGWEQVTCRHCKKFIGNNPIDHRSGSAG